MFTRFFRSSRRRPLTTTQNIGLPGSPFPARHVRRLPPRSNQARFDLASPWARRLNQQRGLSSQTLYARFHHSDVANVLARTSGLEVKDLEDSQNKTEGAQAPGSQAGTKESHVAVMSTRLLQPKQHIIYDFSAVPTSFTEFNFRRDVPENLPLKAGRLQDISVAGNKWKITLIERPTDIYTFNLRMSSGKELGKLKLLVVCKPDNRSNPLDSFAIGLHENGDLSLIAIPRAGNHLTMCQALSGAAVQGKPSELESTSVVNDNNYYQFSLQTGADPRARACIVVNNEDANALATAEAFVHGIHDFSQLNGDMLKLVGELAQQWHLKQASFSCPDDIERFHSKHQSLFRDYPNQIPYTVERKDTTTFPATIIRDFPHQIPDIHRAILAQDIAMLKRILQQNPDAIYQLDSHGLLPIRTALCMHNSEMGMLIYHVWNMQPKRRQMAADIFISTAYDFLQQEANTQGIVVDNFVQQNIRHYFSEIFPGIDNPLAVYEAVYRNDQVELTRLTATELDIWQRLRDLVVNQELELARNLFSIVLSKDFDIFTALMNGDWLRVIAVMEENVPADDKPVGAEIGGTNRNRANKVYMRNKNFSMYPNLFFREILKERMLDILIRDMDADDPGFLDKLRKKMQVIKRDIGNNKALQDEFMQIFQSEIAIFKEVLLAIERNDINALIKLLERRYQAYDFREHPINGLANKFKLSRVDPDEVYNKVSNGCLLPEHSDLYLALFYGDLSKALAYIDDLINKKQTALANVRTVELVKASYAATLPRRPRLHHDVVNGVMPPIKEYIDEKAAYDRYQVDVHEIIADACLEIKAYLEGIDEEELQAVYQSADGSCSYTGREILWRYAQSIVICEAGLGNIRYQFDKSASHCSTSALQKEKLAALFEPVLMIRSRMLASLQDRTARYRAICKCEDDIVYDIYTSLLINQQSRMAYQTVLNKEHDNETDLYLHLKVLKVINEQPDKYAKKLKQLKRMTGCSSAGDKFINSVSQCSLLSYNKQDPWGYTPLLLAVLSNQFDIVRAFLENGLSLDWVMPLDERNINFYTLLSHANSREMVRLLLHYYIDPNSVVCDGGGLNQLLWVLLYYHHDLLGDEDIFGQTLLEYILAGHDYDLCYLKEILKFHKDTVPYDDESVPDDAVKKMLRAHNERVAKVAKRNAAKPKITEAEGVTTRFVTKETKFFSEYKTSAELLEAEKQALLVMFDASFELDNPEYTSAEDFLNKTMLSNPRFISEIYYDEDTNVPIGFFGFQLKLDKNEKGEPFLLLHLSKVACAPEYANSGVMGSALRVVLAIKKYADSLNLPLVGYTRLIEPGLGLLVFPDAMDTSVKYHRPSGDVQAVARAVNDVIGTDGTSFASIRSRKAANGYHRLEAFQFLLHECLPSKEGAALPLVMNIDDAFCGALRAKLSDYGFEDRHIESMVARVPNWVDEQGLQAAMSDEVDASKKQSPFRAKL